MLSISLFILKNLVENEQYFQKVIPYIKEEYFENDSERLFFKHISGFVKKYNNRPTYDAIAIEIANDKTVTETVLDESQKTFDLLKEPKIQLQNFDWLIDQSEKYCKQRAVHLALLESISIADGDNKKVSPDVIPEILKDALSVAFDSSIGHDFIENAPERWDFYHEKSVKIPFNLDMMNKITKNGFAKRTSNIFLAGTHAGKSAFMIHQAANNLLDGKNVVYFTLEMREEEISKRVDANLMGITMDDIETLSKNTFLQKIDLIKKKATGKLIVQEYPMRSASVLDFRRFLNELKMKKNFVADVVYVDYLNLCSPLNKTHSTANSYAYMKDVSEELRGLASSLDFCLITASQLNRTGAENSDPDMGDISESFAVNFGADFIAVLVATQELKNANMIQVKQLKNRYDDMNKIPKFMLGFDRARMKFYDISSNQQNIVSSEIQPSSETGRLVKNSKTSTGNFNAFTF